MRFRDYFMGMEKKAREKYAKRAGTSYGYLYVHLARENPTRSPSLRMLKRLAKASNGALKFEDLANEFAGGKK